MDIKNKGLIKMIITGIVILSVGIIVINHTDSFLKIVMIAAGIGAFVDGLYTLNGMKKWKYTETTKNLATIKGIESIAIGVAAVLIAIFAADAALTVMVYIFAAGLVFSAIVAFQNAATAKKFEIADMRTHFLVEGVITLLIAILLFFKPVETLVKVVQILAIIFIVAGGIMIVVAAIAIFKKPETVEVVVETKVADDEKKD
ncbi:MAG: DUF308 domain-containing protein [Spirochaetales bacterium]|nr:DUF308 domain-containing protein [Spirochaetales bacterium]